MIHRQSGPSVFVAQRQKGLPSLLYQEVPGSKRVGSLIFTFTVHSSLASSSDVRPRESPARRRPFVLVKIPIDYSHVELLVSSCDNTIDTRILHASTKNTITAIAESTTPGKRKQRPLPCLTFCQIRLCSEVPSTASWVLDARRLVIGPRLRLLDLAQ